MMIWLNISLALVIIISYRYLISWLEGPGSISALFQGPGRRLGSTLWLCPGGFQRFSICLKLYGREEQSARDFATYPCNLQQVGFKGDRGVFRCYGDESPTGLRQRTGACEEVLTIGTGMRGHSGGRPGYPGLPRRELRRQFEHGPQDAWLYEGTIKDDLRFGNPRCH